jgi:hypothetical protein
MDSMFALVEASSEWKPNALLLGVAAAVATLLLGADLFAFVGGVGDSSFYRRQLRNDDGVVNSRELLWKMLTNFFDPKSVIYKEEYEEQYDIMNKAAANGSPYFRVHPNPRIDNGKSIIFLPSEFLVEVLNPTPGCDYSVTVQSHNLYTGTAMLLAEGQFTTDECQFDLRQCHRVYSWKPILPGQYDILVHEIDQGNGKTPLIHPPHPIYVTELNSGAGLSMLEDRILNMPPCQIRTEKNLYSHWEGDWLGPDFRLKNSIRTGWSFLPSRRMNCKLETFDSQSLQSLREKKSIYILGRSVERGIFLSLADIMLDEHEKRFLGGSIVGKCWGRATITKGNLKILYQDFRSANFEDPNEPPSIECHNDKLVKYAGSSFITNATKLWEEIFQQDESDWPSVIYFVAGFARFHNRIDPNAFIFDYHVKLFVDMLPPTWQGTMFIGDFTLSGRDGGYENMLQYEEYLKDINDMVNLLGNDPRVRWIDGHGISKEMRMYNQQGEKRVARSQHFHRYCTNTGINGEAMAVCSNVTEMLGQLLLGHALGPKADFTEQAKRTPSDSGTLTWCHACPECLLPFAIVPYPNMTCVRGPMLRWEKSVSCSNKNLAPLLCPSFCLQQEVTSEFTSESDTVFVRQCQIALP